MKNRITLIVKPMVNWASIFPNMDFFLEDIVSLIAFWALDDCFCFGSYFCQWLLRCLFMNWVIFTIKINNFPSLIGTERRKFCRDNFLFFFVFWSKHVKEQAARNTEEISFVVNKHLIWFWICCFCLHLIISNNYFWQVNLFIDLNSRNINSFTRGSN